MISDFSTISHHLLQQSGRFAHTVIICPATEQYHRRRTAWAIVLHCHDSLQTSSTIGLRLHELGVLYNTLFSREENFAKSEFEIFSREDIFANLLFTREYLPAKISSRENILSRKYLPAKIILPRKSLACFVSVASFSLFAAR